MTNQTVENHFAEVGKMVSLISQYVQNLNILPRTILTSWGKWFGYLVNPRKATQ